MCCDSVGFTLLDKEFYASSTPGIASLSTELTHSGRMNWLCIDAAHAKKAEFCAVLIPSPPCLTGRDA